MVDYNSVFSASSFGPALGISLAAGLAGVLVVLALIKKVMAAASGDVTMVNIATSIQDGSKAFLRREYKYLSFFVVIVALILIALDVRVAFCFLVGAFLSASTGYLGMYIAVRANVRTAEAAKMGLNPALRVAFNSGTVMGVSVVSFGILGLSILTFGFRNMNVMAGFGFGASSIALFARVGGGIYTKAADVGADLVGKVETGIPEDDPRNPATIADNVGDNVGDVAGMGADLFESYVGSIIGACTLGISQFADDEDKRNASIIAPFWIAGLGIVASIIGAGLVRTREGASQHDLLAAIRRGIFSASVLVIGGSLIVCLSAFPGSIAMKAFLCVVIGLVAGIMIGTATEYCTSFAYKPTQSIARSAVSGAAPVVIQGMGIGMLSTVAPVLVMFVAILSCHYLLDLYGVAIAAVGMLSTLGVTLATDAYGPVADNAGGIAEMAELREEVRERTDALDALGNTTAATGKGFAIGSAVLTALALMSAFTHAANLSELNLMDRVVIPGLLIGATLPFLFAALTMLAVGRSAGSIIEQVRKQFRQRPGILDGSEEPDAAWYMDCVDISTRAACEEMILPGCLAVFLPLTVGFLLGSKGLAGMLIGAISAGFLLAVTMANAGGAWDNAKKWIEAGGLGPGNGKGSEAHKGAVAGDTVGDPFKDTSGPALNILIKLMSIVSLVFAPAFEEGPSAKSWIALPIVLALLVISFFTYRASTHRGITASLSDGVNKGELEELRSSDHTSNSV